MDFYLSLELLSFILCLFICKGVQADYNDHWPDNRTKDSEALPVIAIVMIVLAVLIIFFSLCLVIWKCCCNMFMSSTYPGQRPHGPPLMSTQVTNVYVPHQQGLINPGYIRTPPYSAGQHPPPQPFYNPQYPPEPPPKYSAPSYEYDVTQY